KEGTSSENRLSAPRRPPPGRPRRDRHRAAGRWTVAGRARSRDGWAIGPARPTEAVTDGYGCGPVGAPGPSAVDFSRDDALPPTSAAAPWRRLERSCTLEHDGGALANDRDSRSSCDAGPSTSS